MKAWKSVKPMKRTEEEGRRHPGHSRARTQKESALTVMENSEGVKLTSGARKVWQLLIGNVQLHSSCFALTGVSCSVPRTSVVAHQGVIPAQGFVFYRFLTTHGTYTSYRSVGTCKHTCAHTHAPTHKHTVTHRHTQACACLHIHKSSKISREMLVRRSQQNQC